MRAGRLEAVTLRHPSSDVRLITSNDIPVAGGIGPLVRDEPVLPDADIRYLGQALAIVAVQRGSHLEGADADALVDIQYREEGALYRPQLADMFGARTRSRALAAEAMGQREAVRAVIAEASHVASSRFYFPPVRHGYLCADQCTAIVEEGRLIITTGCHALFELRDQVAALLGCPPNTVVVRSGASGGSFGGLLDHAVPALAAVAAWALQSGVELDVGASAHRAFGPHSNAIGAEITMACEADGRVRALDLDVRVDAGAYTSYGLGVMRRVLAHAAGPYDIKHVHAAGTLVWTNDRPASAFRGFGVGPHTVMLEAMVESLAADLGIDALDVRERSLARAGGALGNGQPVPATLASTRCLERCRIARDELLAESVEASPHEELAVGTSLFVYGIGNTGQRNPASVRVESVGKGRVRLHASTSDTGQGSHRALRRICADQLGLAPDAVELVSGDTDRTPDAGKTSASRTVHFVGNAVRDAVAALIADAVHEASDRWPGVCWDDERKTLIADEERITLDAVRRICARDLVGEGRFDPVVDASRGFHYPLYAAGANVVRLRFDTETGAVTLDAAVAIHDVGVLIDPASAEGQAQGGFAMGASTALSDDGEPDAPFRFLRSTAVPRVAVQFIADGRDLRDAKGLGEPAAIGAASAIFNAWRAAQLTLPVNLHPFQSWAVKCGS